MIRWLYNLPSWLLGLLVVCIWVGINMLIGEWNG